MRRSFIVWFTPWLALASVGCSPPIGRSGREQRPVPSGVESRSPSQSSSSAVDPARQPLRIEVPERVTVDERQPLALHVTLEGADGDEVRVCARGLPPGARWDEGARTLHFRPDFIQGGAGGSWLVTFVADDGRDPVEAVTTVTVRDTVRPPWPQVRRRERAGGYERIDLSQRTDDFLDAPEHAGRTFAAVVTRPDDASPERRRPVLVRLHGFAMQPRITGSRAAFVISPADPDNTYWWGYRAEVGGTEQVPPYTQRRVLHLLEWVLRHEPGADPERVFISGRSMGGAGAATLGLRSARHFAGVDARYWQSVPLHHRRSRIAQLSTLWGTPEQALSDGSGDDRSVWERMDLTRVLLEEPEARDQWLFSFHAKDDPIIHFGALVTPSPSTELSLHQALQQTGTGHLALWDEGAHGTRDPVLGASWWNAPWDPWAGRTLGLARDRAFVAFSRASHDDDPGTGGNGLHPWSDDAGFAADRKIAGDTGWSGDRAGGINRFLRWDGARIIDEPERFEVPLWGDQSREGSWPVRVDVTLRRVQRFCSRPGEVVDWTLGEHEGEAVADASGELTITGVPLTPHEETLTVVRRERSGR